MTSGTISRIAEMYEMEWKNCVYFPFVLRTQECPWNWYFLSMHSNITLEMILLNPSLPWEWDAVSLNPNLTRKLVLENRNKKWNICNLNNNPSLQDPPIQLPSKKENIKGDILNIKVIASTPDTAWNFGAFCTNPSLTIELIESNINKKWDWNVLSMHTFYLQMKEYVASKIKENYLV